MVDGTRAQQPERAGLGESIGKVSALTSLCSGRLARAHTHALRSDLAPHLGWCEVRLRCPSRATSNRECIHSLGARLPHFSLRATHPPAPRTVPLCYVRFRVCVVV